MVLHTVEQEIQKYHRPLGINPEDGIQFIIDLCKGRIDEWRGGWFYYLFISSKKAMGIPDSLSAVRSRLQSAWWIEDEDLKQEILYIIWKLDLNTKKDWIFHIGRNMKDYLVSQRIFSRQLQWQDSYQYEVEIQSPPNTSDYSEKIDVSVIFRDKGKLLDLSLHDRYMIYLSCVLELHSYEIEDVLLNKSRNINRFRNILKKRLEAQNARS